MSVQFSPHVETPIPIHLAGLRSLGLGLVRLADRAANRRLLRLEADQDCVRVARQLRLESLREDRRREQERVEALFRQLR